MLARIFFFTLSFCILQLGGQVHADKTTLPDWAVIRHQFSNPKEQLDIVLDATKTHQAAIQNILAIPAQDKNFENTVAAIEAADRDLNIAVEKVDFMSSVGTSEAVVDGAVAASKAYAKYRTEYSADPKVYEALKTVLSQGGLKNPEDKEKARLLQTMVEEKEAFGVGLPLKERGTFKKLLKELEAIQIDFSQAINKSSLRMTFTEAELRGLPADQLAKFQRKSYGGLEAKLSIPLVSQIMMWVESEETRRRVHTAWENRVGLDNMARLERVLQLRSQIANSLGFNNWSDYANSSRQSKSHLNVMDFLTKIQNTVKPVAIKETEILKAYKAKIFGGPKADPTQVAVQPWDQAYLINHIQKRYYGFDESEVRKYFPAHETLKKIMDLYAALLGIEFKPIENAPVWDPSVKAFEIRDKKSGEVYSYFYADLFPRQFKRQHFTAFQIVPSYYENGKRRPAVTAIVCNFNEATKNMPATLSPDEIETLLHELGHIMHASLSEAAFAKLSGYNTVLDFVEVPSQLMENIARDPQRLSNLSGRYDSPDKKLPLDLAKKVIEASELGKARFVMRQTFLGLFDQMLHRQPINYSVDIFRAYKEAYKAATGIEPPAGSLFPTVFNHLMGYNAGYYSYMWALSNDYALLEILETKGFLNSEVWAKYRATILAGGNTEPAVDLLARFNDGNAPTTEAFQRYLLKSNCADLIERLKGD